MNAGPRVAAAAQFRVACKMDAPDRGETVDGAKKFGLQSKAAIWYGDV